MKNASFFLSLGLLVLFSQLFVSCCKDEDPPVPTNTITIYYDAGFAGGGLKLEVLDYSQEDCIDLGTLGYSKKITSVKWDLAPGFVVNLWKGDCENSATLRMTLVGEYSDLKTESFDDAAVNVSWTVE